MVKIFGHFDDPPMTDLGYLKLVFSPSSLPLKQRWRNNGLSANFMADYLTAFFPSDDMDSKSIKRQVDIKGTVSYIANELLENAMKFNDDSSNYPISIKLQLCEDCMVFYLTNSVSPLLAERFQAYIQELLNSDPQELYIHQLESHAQENCHYFSQLGILTMINDYLVKIGWKFETIQNYREVIRVSTIVRLNI